MVYAPCFILITAVSPESGSSRVAGFCIRVEMSENLETWRANVRLIIGIHFWLVTSSGALLINEMTQPHIYAFSLSLLPVGRRDRCLSIKMSLLTAYSELAHYLNMNPTRAVFHDGNKISSAPILHGTSIVRLDESTAYFRLTCCPPTSCRLALGFLSE